MGAIMFGKDKMQPGILVELRQSHVDDLRDEKPNVRLCENFTCGLPVYDPAELKL